MGTIKFTLRAESQTRSFRFSKDLIIFGNGEPENFDVLITDLPLSSEHFKIVNQAGKFVAINSANDPFITLNGFPFGKKTLKVGDVIQIRDVEVIVDSFNEEEEPSNLPAPKTEKRVEETKEPVADLKPGNPVFEDLSTLEIESFLGDAHEEPEPVLKSTTQTNSPAKSKELSPKETFGRLSLKDDPYQENDEDQKPVQNVPKIPSPPTGWKMQWKYLAWGVTLLFVITGLIASEMYLRLTNMSEDEEMLAAEGVADIAMALTYAKLHAVNPASQNWSDPEFLRHSLLAILSPSTIASSGIMNSQNNSSHYLLRIYTSYDLTRFLVVAQPTPSLMQMWVPKHAIIVDSRMMYLRKTMDFKALNKFLAYTYPLDESHTAELDQLISSSKMIPLSYVAEVTENLEFMPPKALGFLRPGAENRIYNAPRYHEFGEAVLMHALTRQDLPNVVDDDWDVNDELEKLASLDNFVLYVPEKITLSPHASDLFSALPLEGKFLLGYLNITNDGKIKSSHLMMQNDHIWNRDSEVPQQDVAEIEPMEDGVKSPLQADLSRLAHSRMETLKLQREKIAQELDKHIHDNNAECLQNACDALQDYDKLAMKHSLMIREELHKLKKDYPDVPDEDFEKAVNEAGLGLFLEQHSEKKEGQ